MTTRRSLLKGLTMGAGSLALAPFLNHFSRAEEENGQLPQRFVFVVKASGLQADFINPAGLQHGGDSLVDEPLAGRELAESMAPLAPFQQRLMILQGLSGKMCNFGHSSFYGALGAYKATLQGQPAAATIDGHLANRLPSVFNHIGLKMGDGSQGTAYPAISAAGKNRQLPFSATPSSPTRTCSAALLLVETFARNISGREMSWTRWQSRFADCVATFPARVKKSWTIT